VAYWITHGGKRINLSAFAEAEYDEKAKRLTLRLPSGKKREIDGRAAATIWSVHLRSQFDADKPLGKSKAGDAKVYVS
jgi:ribosomal protein L2